MIDSSNMSQLFIYKNFPKYERLKELELNPPRGKVIDVFVNMDSIVDTIYSEKYMIFNNSFDIITAVINLCIHLRRFFLTRYNAYPRVFIVNGKYRPNLAVQYYPVYGAHKEMERTLDPVREDLVRFSREQLKNIVPYLPDIFYIESEQVESAVLARCVLANRLYRDHGIPSVRGIRRDQISGARYIFSRSLYDYQLVATVPNMTMVRVKKFKSDDISFKINFGDFYFKLSQYELKLKKHIGDGLSPELYSLLMCIGGIKDRNFSSLYSKHHVSNMISKAISSGIMINGYQMPTDQMLECFGVHDGIHAEIMNRFLSYDIINQQRMYIATGGDIEIEKSFIDLFDPEGLRRINNEYFSANPIDLDAL